MPPKSDKRERPEQVIRFTSGGAKFKAELWPGNVNILRQRPRKRSVKNAAGQTVQVESKIFISIGRLTFTLHPGDSEHLDLKGAFTLNKLPLSGKTRETEEKLLLAAEQLISVKHPEIKKMSGNVVDMRNLREPLDVGTLFTELITLRQRGGKFRLARAMHGGTAKTRQEVRRGTLTGLPVLTPEKPAKRKTPAQKPRHVR
jgi:hypothetical protein